MKQLCVILSLLLLLISISAYKSNNTTPTTENSDYLSEIMKKSDEYPQLTKDQFIEATNEYLSTDEWVLPIEKACFYTYGTNFSAYIINNEYLFELHIQNNQKKSIEYIFHLSHYKNGTVIESETSASNFEHFIK